MREKKLKNKIIDIDIINSVIKKNGKGMKEKC